MAIDTSYSGGDINDINSPDYVPPKNQATWEAARAAAPATPAAPASTTAPALPLAQPTDASTQPVNRAAPSSGPGTQPVGPTTPIGTPASATSDPMAFLPSSAGPSGGYPTPSMPVAGSALPLASGTTPTVEQATQAQDAANTTAHTTVGGGLVSQGTDPYGRYLDSNTPGATASNTYAPVEQLTPQQQQDYWTQQFVNQAAKDGTTYAPPKGDENYLTDLAANGDGPALSAQIHAADAKQNPADGFMDPAIRAQFFNPDGTPKSTGGTASGTDANGLPTTAEPPVNAPIVPTSHLSPNGPASDVPQGGSGTGLPGTAGPSGGFPTPFAPTIGGPAPSTAGPSGGYPVPSAPTAPNMPSAPSQPTVPSTPGTDANGLPIPTAAGNASYNLTPTNPANSLSNSTITPGAGVDRFKIATDQYNAARDASEPQYQADLRDATRMAAATGTIGSGSLNTSLGNIANTRSSTLAKQQSDLLNGALTGSIDDAYRNIGIAQQQQGVQIGQQNTAFGQGMSLQQLQDSEQGQRFTQQMQALGFSAQQIQQAFQNAYQTQQLGDTETNTSFSQALQKLLAGSAGSPADLQLVLAQIYGGDSAAAAAAAARYYQTNGNPAPTSTTTTPTGTPVPTTSTNPYPGAVTV